MIAGFVDTNYNGEDFDLVEFHRLVLGTGSVPLQALGEVVEDYLGTK